MKHVIPVPKMFDENKHDAGHIHAWLEDQGITVAGVSLVRPHGATGDESLAIEVDSDQDPTGVIPTFAPPINEDERLLAELDAIDVETADMNDLRRSMNLMRQLLTLRKEPRHAR